MESESSLAPPVVAVTVVHDPGEWFDESVASLAAQDYPNLRFLFLLADTSDAGLVDTEQRIRAAIPDAFVRAIDSNPGYGAVANEVLQLVEGDNGFFLLCHDDIAPDRDAVRLLVEELYRSNAGLVGPKLVDWHRPGILQHVGLGLDRYGEIDPITEPDEADQEQHDGVGDVFVVPSACMLVRADLFRALGGFDPAVSYHGDDVDLCWRAHLSGARVVVAPQARVRHLEALDARRPDLNHRVLRARHRMRTVATLTSASRLPLRSIELVLLTVAELVVGLFTGRFAEAWSSLRALVGLIPRTPLLIARRRAVSGSRTLPDTEILDLQIRGSARLTSYLRTRETMTYLGVDATVRRWRENSVAMTVAWVAVVAALLIGSRSFFTSSVPAVGEFLPFPESAGDLWDTFTSGWRSGGFGDTAPNPTGLAFISLLSAATLFNMGMAHTIAVVGLVLAGIVGAGRVVKVFPSTRARIAGFVVYGAAPLVAGLMADGRWTGLVAYAAVPWFVHGLRLAAGISTADPRAGEADLVDGVVSLSARERVRYIAWCGLLAGLAGAFAPVVVVLLLAVGVVLALATLLAGGSHHTAGWMLAASAATGALGFVLNLPWSTTWSWTAMTLPPGAGPPAHGLIDVATLGLGGQTFGTVAVALYLPLVAALAISRAWRLTWTVRAAMLVVVFGAVAVLGDRGTIDMRLPDVSLLLVPVGLGLAVGAAGALAAFDLDVRGADFGWRQPLGVLAGVAVVIGVVPGVVAMGDGRWSTPTTPFTALLQSQLVSPPDSGVGRVLFIGEPESLPVPGHELTDGVAFAVVDEGDLDVRDRWYAPETEGDQQLRNILTQMANGETVRGGRVLGVLGIRRVVIPRSEVSASAPDQRTDVPAGDTDDDADADDDDGAAQAPAGLIGALRDQLDLAQTVSPLRMHVFENRAFIPVTAQLTGASASASTASGIGELIQADLSSAAPAFSGLDTATASGGEEVDAGVIHLATPFDEQWSLLRDDGSAIDPRVGFGLTTAFDVDDGGSASLQYDSPASRRVWLVALGAMWVIVLVMASRVRVPFSRRSTGHGDETLMDIDASGPDVDLDDQLAMDDPGGWITEVIDTEIQPDSRPAGPPTAGPPSPPPGPPAAPQHQAPPAPGDAAPEQPLSPEDGGDR